MEAFAPVRRRLLRILCVALALRVGAAVALNWYLDERLHRVFLIEGDAEGYWDLAGDIASGREYAVYEPPRRVLRMPGFPALLAIPRWLFGDSLPTARLWLAAIASLGCAGVSWLGQELFDTATARVGALMAAVYPALVLFSAVELSDMSFATALVFNLAAGARLLRAHREARSGESTSISTRRWALVTGVLAAVTTYVHPSWLLAAPLFGVALVGLSPRRPVACRDAVLIQAALLLALLPWAWRNQQVAGHLVFTTLWLGPSLYDGLNPEATGDSNMTFYDRDNLMGRGMSEYDVDRHYRRAAWEFARANPRRVVELALVKLGRFWKPWPNAEQFRGIGPAVLIAAWFLPLIVLSLIGGWASRGDLWKLLLTAGPILYLAALHAVFVSSLRYRLPAELPLMVLAAAGWQRLRSAPRLPTGGA